MITETIKAAGIALLAGIRNPTKSMAANKIGVNAKKARREVDIKKGIS